VTYRDFFILEHRMDHRTDQIRYLDCIDSQGRDVALLVCKLTGFHGAGDDLTFTVYSEGVVGKDPSQLLLSPINEQVSILIPEWVVGDERKLWIRDFKDWYDILYLEPFRIEDAKIGDVRDRFLLEMSRDIDREILRML